MVNLFVLCGKSYVGKRLLYNNLIKLSGLGLIPVVRYTSRECRVGEGYGEDYHFLSQKVFDKFIEDGKFVEYQKYTFGGTVEYYGTTLKSIAEDGDYLMINNLSGLESMLRYAKGIEGMSVIPIYIESPWEDRLKRAIREERKQDIQNYTEVLSRMLIDESDFCDSAVGRLVPARNCVYHLTTSIASERIEKFIRKELSKKRKVLGIL